MSKNRRSRLPLGLLGMLVLVAGVEGVAARRSPERNERIAVAWRYGRDAADAGVRRAVLLCMGDSLVKLGVQPPVLEARLNRPVRNLAIPGGQGPSTYFLLRRALASGARPSAILLDVHPILLSSAPRFNTTMWPELVSPVEAIELGLAARDAKLLTSTLLGAIFPTIRHRLPIREDLLGTLAGTDPFAEVGAYVRNWRVNGGGQVTPAQAGPPEPDSWGRGNAPHRWRPHRTNLAFLEKALALAASEGMTVYWLIPPVTPEWQAHLDAIGIGPAYERFVREMAAKHPHLVVLDGRDSGFGPENFRDTTHLHGPGSIRLSETLAIALAGPVPADRWLTLPAIAPPVPGLALEDLDASKAALRGRSSTRR